MSMFNKVTKTFQWGQHTVTIGNREIARQASRPAPWSTSTTPWCSPRRRRQNQARPDFFLLTVDLSKTYAAGKIPWQLPAREGRRRSELET